MANPVTMFDWDTFVGLVVILLSVIVLLSAGGSND